TAARTGEALGARWDEIDLQGRWWTVPAARMKSRKEHRVPLSDRAYELVLDMAEIAGDGSFVFPGLRTGKPLADRALFRLLRSMGRDDITVHGFRSTFADWAVEQTNFPSEARELALAHSVGSSVEAAYRRSDLSAKRRELMATWARFIDDGEAGGATVV